MNFPGALFPDDWAWAAWVFFLAVLVWCVRTAPWRRLADSGQHHVWLGTVVVLTLMWSMRAGVRPGMALHLIGATAFSLMFGRQLAVLGLCVVLGAVTLNTGGSWQPYALSALSTILLPVLVSQGMLWFSERFLPANFFVFIFVATFFAAALSAVAAGLAVTLMLLLAGIYPAEMLFSDYFPYFVLLGFAEAWLNGAAITLMVVYLPHWVGAFDDRRYLWRK